MVLCALRWERIVVFPAPSRPSIKILFSFFVKRSGTVKGELARVKVAGGMWTNLSRMLAITEPICSWGSAQSDWRKMSCRTNG